MRNLFPEIRPNETFYLQAGSHELYVEESGNSGGLPVLFLHGGPGAGSRPYHRRFFDPEIYRIIVFDQRGAGRSRPHAELANNTTKNLISDIELIREHFSIEQWLVFGGSWGSTLALLYAQAYPNNVLGLILRGIFLCRRHEIAWFYQQGASRVFPDYWRDFLAPIPESERDDMVAAYYARLTGDDEIARMAAAKAWAQWEARCASLQPDPGIRDEFADPHVALSLARIEAHYFYHDCFLAPNQILRDAHRLHHIPGVIVHGRYDLICPLENAVQLQEAWPAAQLKVISDAGHAATEPRITDALLKATQEMSQRFARD